METIEKRKRGRPRSSRPTVAVQARLPDDLYAELTELAYRQRNSVNRQIAIAVIEHLDRLRTA